MAVKGGGLLLTLMALGLLEAGAAQLVVRAVGSDTAFADPSNIVVGFASDLILQVECLSENGTGDDVITWSRNGTTVASGLQAFGVSQEAGMLRVHPVRELDTGGNEFVCSSNGTSELDVVFSLVDDLFFTAPPLSSAAIPDIPEATVTTVQESGSFYFMVDSERGVYRSASNITIPSFREEPEDMIVRNISGFSTAAFVCSTFNPGSLNVTITWMFRAMDDNDSSPLIDDGLDDLVTILDTQSDPSVSDISTSTSILLLASVTEEREGFYSCQVEYCCGSLESVEAMLTYNATPISGGPVIIFPSDTFITYEDVPTGVNFTIPCVASDLSLPSVAIFSSIPVNVISSEVTIGGLNVAFSAMSLFIQLTVGTETLSVTLLSATTPAQAVVSPDVVELVVVEGESVSLTCTPSEEAMIVVNNINTNANSFQTAMAQRNDTGFYQCLTSSSVDSVYLLVAYLDPVEIATPSLPVLLDLSSLITASCSSLGSPLPRLSWSIDPPAPLATEQFPTAFMDPANSSVAINISSLSVRSYTVTCTSNISEVSGTPLTSAATFNFSLIFEDIITNVSVSDEMVSLFCSVEANVVPEMMFMRNGSALTGTNVTSNDILHQISLDINTSTFNLGTEIITCTSTLGLADMPTLSANISIEIFLENIIANSSISDIVIRDEEEMVTLFCSVEANVVPEMMFIRNGSALTGTNVTSNGILHQISLDISTSSFDLGTEVITCTLTLGLADMPTLSANISIDVSVIFENISITQQPDPVIFLDFDPQTVTLNCTLESSVTPAFTWSRNGDVVSGPDPVLLKDTTYISTLSLTNVTAPGEMVECVASINISETQAANVSVMVVVFRDIAISPEEPVLNITQGEDVGVVILNCTLEASPIPEIVWTQGGMEQNGTEAVRTEGSDLGVESSLAVNVVDLRGEVSFTCVASLDAISANLSADITITINTSPVFTVDPVNSTVAVEGDTVTLNCSAEGYPAPSITWEDEEGQPITDDITFDIMFTNISTSMVSSSLSFNASNRTNGSTFRCVATNILSRTESGLGQLLLSGPPGQPVGFNVTMIASTSVDLVWMTPASLIPLLGYSLNITSEGGVVFMTDLDVVNVSITVSSELSPFTMYRAVLVARNRAGQSEAEITFITAEAVPGAPLNILTSARSLGVIIVTWDLPTEQNGILTGYTVRFNQTTTTVLPNVTTLRVEDLLAGTTYLVDVAASTAVGIGDYSDPISQATVAIPPPPGGNPNMPGDITQNSISITLPEIASADLDSFSHLWVIAMKVAEDMQLPDNPLSLFPNNASFVFYSKGNISTLQPYVTAEMEPSAYNNLSASGFVLGDPESTSSLNDNSLYLNGPLNQSTSYTVFVWGFSPTPADGFNISRRRRETSSAMSVRQYSGFSSTGFLPPVSTAGAAGGLSPGAIVGIVVAIVIVVLLIVAIFIVGAFLYDRYKYQSELGPPPSRKGSMRLRDHNEVVRSSLRSSFRAMTLRNQKAEAELQDLNPEDARIPVSVKEFPTYVKSMHKNTDHLFSEEYEILSIKSPSLAHIQCSLPANVSKNRYANINCYDNSRVVLAASQDPNSTDYINANYIDGYKARCAYIASQGPLANTTHDFWRMVWDHETCCVIMLTNLVEKSRVKCHQYWPEVGSMNMGDITIMLVEVQELAYYTIRTLRLTRHNTVREVKQFHYTGWPDFGVPDYPHPVLAFLRRLTRYKRSTPGPDVFHCSAGVGRTGTLIAIQSMIHMMQSEEGMLDIFNFVLGMRQQRNYMVQTERQYIFIHDTILEYIRMGDTEVTIQNLRNHYKKLQAHDPRIESSLLEIEYKHLNELEEVDTSQYQPAQSSVNLSKNRYQKIMPYDRYRVRLLLHPGVHGSDYINASYVDGYQRRHQYILTQGPMNNTVTDFWRMVWEHRCSCVMMLCQCEERGQEQSACYWPTDKVRQHGDMFIEQISSNEFPGYVMREFSITNTKINEGRVIKHFQYSDWLESQSPPNAAAVIDLIGVVQKTQHTCGGGPIIVHDNTSVGRSGTFVVLSSVLEQLKVEGVIDPFATIHSLRQQQPGIVSTFEQYRFCYQAVMEFLDSFDHYSNFD